MNLDDCGVIPAAGTADRVRPAGRVVLARVLAGVGGAAAFCGVCAVTWLTVVTALSDGCFLLLVIVPVGRRETSLGRMERARHGGWSSSEDSGAR